MTSPRILVAGAGYLGLAFAEISKGSEVTLARRSPKTTEGFRTVACDFTDPSTFEVLPEVDCIYYAVAADGASEEAYEKAYFVGLRNLVDHYQKQDKKPAFFYSSSTSVYAAADGEPCFEDSPLVETGLSRFMVEGERYLLNSALRGTVLRYGGLYGPGRTSFLRRVSEGLESLTPQYPHYTNRIHQADAVRMVAFLYEQKAEGIFNAVDQAPALRDDVIRFVAQEVGIDPSTLPISEQKPTRGHKHVRSDKIQKLGYSFEVPSYREGYRPLIQSP